MTGTCENGTGKSLDVSLKKVVIDIEGDLKIKKGDVEITKVSGLASGYTKMRFRCGRNYKLYAMWLIVHVRSRF
ncbi:hypothetical protein ACFX13_026890 [Malus domestica]